MSTKNKLAIFLITYNRKEKLHKTLEAILAKNSPIKNYDITILDNASTDGSSELIDEYCAKHQNLKHIRHGVNIGGNANICRAFEMGAACGKEYFWVLCDDDDFDWENWQEINDAILSGKYAMIYTINQLAKKNSNITTGYLAFLVSFIPGVIYKTSIISSDILQNMYGMIHTWFPQSILSLHILCNLNEIYYFPKNNIVIRGVIENVNENIASLTRGINKKLLHPDLDRMFWHLGFAKVSQIVKDKKTRKQVITQTNFNEDWEQNFFNYLCSYFQYNCYKNNSIKNNIDMISCLCGNQKIIFILSYLHEYMIKFLPIRYRNTPKGIILVLFWKLKIRIWSNAWIKKLKN